MQLRSLIVDDVSSSRRELLTLLKENCPEVTVTCEAENIKEAGYYLASGEVDVVFLDIEMPGGNGFELLERFRSRNFQVVFVTGHENYSLRAIKMHALDYLVKPVDLTELCTTVHRLKEIKEDESNFMLMQRSLARFQEQLVHSRKTEHLTLHHLNGFDIVEIREILYLKAERGYTAFVMKNGQRILVSKILKVFDEMLSDHGFIRIHKSYLVNIYHVRKYKHEDVGWVIMANGDRLEVARRRNADFMAAIDAMKIFGS